MLLTDWLTSVHYVLILYHCIDVDPVTDLNQCHVKTAMVMNNALGLGKWTNVLLPCHLTQYVL